MNTTTKTFRQMLTRNLTAAAVLFAAFALLAGPFYGKANANWNGTPAPTQAQILAEAHDCHPSIQDGDLSAVVTLPGDDTPTWTGDLPAKAQRNLFGATVYGTLPEGAIIHAFCTQG